MNLLGKVRRLHYRGGPSLSEIERRTDLTRKTIRKWLKEPERRAHGTGVPAQHGQYQDHSQYRATDQDAGDRCGARKGPAHGTEAIR